jgi:hypothetical protein
MCDTENMASPLPSSKSQTASGQLAKRASMYGNPLTTSLTHGRVVAATDLGAETVIPVVRK